MFWKTALASCLLVALVPGGVYSRAFLGWLPNFFGTPANNSTTGALGGARQVVNTIAGIKSSALHSVVNATKQALDFGADMTSSIPLVGSAVKLGTGVAKAGADTVNAIGQAKISFYQRLKNAKLNMIERLTGGLLFGTTTTAMPTTTAAGTTPTTTSATTPITTSATTPTTTSATTPTTTQITTASTNTVAG